MTANSSEVNLIPIVGWRACTHHLRVELLGARQSNFGVKKPAMQGGPQRRRGSTHCFLRAAGYGTQRAIAAPPAFRIGDA